MIAHTTPSQIPIFMEVRNINPAGYGALTPVPGTDGHVMFSAIHRRTRIRLEMNHGVPHFTVRVHVDGNITETYPADAINLTPEMLNKVNQVEADLLQKEDMKFIQQTQQMHVDVFGFGEYVRTKHPKFWAEHIGSMDQWDAMYAHIPIVVRATARVHRTGMLGR